MARAKKIVEATTPSEAEKPAPTIAYKGFGMDWTCRGYQFEVGKTFRHEGRVKACEGGFHACEHPLDVFNYYAPAESRFAVVELSGETDRHGDDSKIAAAEITIKAELRIPDIVAAAVKYVFDRAKWSDKDKATGSHGAASATGDYGAASATGSKSSAVASGYAGKASASEGSALFLAERDDDYTIIAVWAGIAGRDGIKPDTFYTLRDGKPQEVAA